MTRPFLFGGTTNNQSQSKYLVEFKAGKMTMQGNMVHPDKRKGLVYINQTEDSLMHFCWKDRTTGAVEDDLIIFPDDVEFKRVPQCTTGRVYVLKFKSSSRKCFYWMQEPKTDKDEEYCNKVNEYLNNPPIPGSTRSSALGGGGSSSQGGGLHSELSNLGDSDLQNLLNNMSQQQLMQLLAGGVGGMTSAANLGALLGGSRTPSGQSCTSVGSSNQNSRSTATEATATTGPSDAKSSSTVPTPSDSEPQSQGSVTSTTSATPASGTSTQGAQIQLSDLQNILSGLNVQSGDRGAAAAAVDLSTAITAEALQPLLTNQEFMSRVRELLPTVADSAGGAPTETVSEQLRTTVQSPQFQQALSGFSAALQSGQLGPLMQQFGMPQEVIDAANSGDMEAFIRALQNSRDKKDPGGDKDDKGGDDEEMSLD